MDDKPAIREFLRELLAQKGDTEAFSDQTSLVLSGRLQSIDAVNLAVFLEDKFQVDFANIGFDQETIDTVDAIATLVEGSRTR
jgi:acyl carrier protein